MKKEDKDQRHDGSAKERDSNLKNLNANTAMNFFSGKGEMALRIRELDWASHPLGPAQNWPAELVSTLSICLSARFPMAIYWGKEGYLFYNDAWRPIVGDKHPWAIGRAAQEVWPEIWESINPPFQSVRSTGEATWQGDALLPMHRFGYTEECYFDYSFNPIRGQSGKVEGILNIVQETTFRLLNDRRTKLLSELAASSAAAETERSACEMAMSAIATDPGDIPFALLYLVDPERLVAKLIASTGLPQASPAMSSTIDLGAESCSNDWPLKAAYQQQNVVKVDDLAQRFGTLPGGLWPEPSTQALILPVDPSGHEGVTAILVAGVSPRRKLDNDYQRFLELVASHVASTLASARAYEEERKRAEALAELDRAKTAFFSNVSHEFRTPLTLMIGPMEDLLARSRNSQRLEEAKELEVIHRNSLRLLKLVNTLLDFSRIEAGRIQAAYAETDLERVTSDLSSVFRSAMEKAGLRFVVDCQPLPEPVFVDRDMWEKIIFNLLSNAFKFTLQGEVRVSLYPENNQAVLKVSDTGLGIPAEELSNVFKRFHRVENARGRTHEGTGIGLALVSELVKQHSGTVEVESRLGHGTTFQIRIPFGKRHLPPDLIVSEQIQRSTAFRGDAFVEEALTWLPQEVINSTFRSATETRQDASPAGMNQQAEAADGGERSTSSLPGSFPGLKSAKPHILLAEDNADMRDYVHRLLMSKYHVEAVSNGAAALEAARTQTPDLILSDVMMPVMNGFELVQQLRVDDTLKAIPVILLSARAGEEARIEGAKYGADDYLTKPFSARELLARIATHLELAAVRKNASAAIENERRRLFDLLMRAPAIICVLRGPEHIFELVNERYLQHIGRPDAEQMLGKPVRAALPELEEQGYVEILDRVYSNDEAFVGNEHKVKLARTANGALEEIYVNFVYQPTHGPNGKVDGIFVHAVDVTEQVFARQQVEELVRRLGRERDRLSEQEAVLRTVTNEAQVGLVIVNKDRRYLFANQAYAQILGLPDANIVGLRVADVLPGVFDQIAPRLDRAFAGERVQYELHKPDSGNPGGDRFYEVVYEPRTVDISDPYVVVVIMDITERKRTQEILEKTVAERTARLRETIGELEAFSYSISHDMRSPLRAMQGFSRALLDDYSDKLDADGKDLLQRIEKGARRLDLLTRDVLAYSKIAKGEFQLHPVELDLLIPEIIQSFEFEAANIHITHPLPQVLGHEALISQVVSNLVGNAIKFTAPGVTPKIQIYADIVGQMSRVWVQDNGIGIAPSHYQRIFEIFGRVYADKDYEGTGIGLAIVKKAVERLGGQIGLKSELGKGSRFWFTLQRK